MTAAAACKAGPGQALRFYGASIALHGALAAALLLARPTTTPRATPIAVEIVETRKAAPAPEPAPPEPPRPAPRPALRPPRVATAPRPPVPDDAPPPAREEAPPPPSAPPAAEARPGPIRIGVSMSSTTTAGGVAAPVGGTLYGRAPPRAEDPGGASASPRYAPPSQVTTLPEPLGCDIPKSEYPEEARRLGIEGEVKLRLVVDEQGLVRGVTIVRDPGHGFGQVAQRCARSYCRFRPALRNGEPVATEIPYTIRFEL